MVCQCCQADPQPWSPQRCRSRWRAHPRLNQAPGRFTNLSDGISTLAQLQMGTSPWGPTGRWKLHAPLQKHDVEQLLWKAVYYRPIEEFR